MDTRWSYRLWIILAAMLLLLYTAITLERASAAPAPSASCPPPDPPLVTDQHTRQSPLIPEPAVRQGYVVERNYYRQNGQPVDLAQPVKQNDRFVVVLKVTEQRATYARLLLVDMLPAGFEIDNPKLVESGQVSGLPWLKNDVTPVNAEYRDDRFVAAFDRYPSQQASFTVAYVVRAVSPGRYVHPPALAEDMYRPDRFGRTAFGTVEVTAAR